MPTGGNFDGDLGAFSALEVIQAVQAAKSRRGIRSRWWCGRTKRAPPSASAPPPAASSPATLQAGDMDQVWNGMKRGDAIRKIAGNPEQIETAIRGKGAWHSYVELHIEQGGTLDKAKVPIGIVEGIVAIHRYDVVIEGQVNHAGTTPMNERHDAMVAAAQLTLAVREIASRRQGRQVGTVGRIEIEPNSPNVIPGRATMSVEFRDLSEQVLRELGDAVKARGAEIAKETGTTINFTLASTNVPAHGDERHPGRRSAAPRPRSSLNTMRLPSGAGHDAQQIAKLCPMGMIFVPSVGGISHSPKELTTLGRLRERRERPAEDGARSRSARQRLAIQQRGRLLRVAGYRRSTATPICAAPGADSRCNGIPIAPATGATARSRKSRRPTPCSQIRCRAPPTIAARAASRVARPCAGSQLSRLCGNINGLFACGIARRAGNDIIELYL